ncbi:hypothetical protein [Hymenobacter wooponensis]|uniref:Uncharacterized protein n=1 Tax=Hymenobacter wooponensis TaxID=1525360 RepID=A0A4Z0MIN2_9BACT|nr:hypothetical protein [Hymenobacter wooponensis]TGD79404.1 hypothetical protein EU557_14320 [Hymenobacter wooponensis]
MNKLYLISPVVAGLLICHTSVGQNSGGESSLVSTSSTNFLQQHTGGATINSRLYNGPEYIFYNKYYRNNVGHQFFNIPEEKPGEVEYDGRYFTNIPLLYDTHLDQVVLTHPTSSLKFRLVNEKVQSFKLQGHTFVRLIAQPVTKPIITTGFYDLLFDKGLQVYAKWEKEMKTKAEQNAVHAIFTEHTNYYAFKDNNYYHINSINDLADLFPENKSDIQKYARSNKLKFNKANRATTLIKLAQYSTSTTH